MIISLFYLQNIDLLKLGSNLVMNMNNNHILNTDHLLQFNYMKYILLGAAIAFAMYLGDKYIL